MVGTISQAIALATHGTAFLKGNNIVSFYPENAAFSFCKEVTFIGNSDSEDRSKYKDLSSDPLVWFENLKKDGVTELVLYYESSDSVKLGDGMVTDRQLAGMVGGRTVGRNDTCRGKTSWARRHRQTSHLRGPHTKDHHACPGGTI